MFNRLENKSCESDTFSQLSSQTLFLYIFKRNNSATDQLRSTTDRQAKLKSQYTFDFLLTKYSILLPIDFLSHLPRYIATFLIRHSITVAEILKATLQAQHN